MMETLLFAFLAGYIFFRLWAVLGKRTGFEAPPPPDEARNAKETTDKAAALPGSRTSSPIGVKRLPSPLPLTRQDTRADNDPALSPLLQEGLQKIQAADPQFQPDHFLQGAAGAFEIIVAAFAKGDREALKPLISPAVYKSFVSVIKERTQAQQTVDTKIASLAVPEIISIDIKNGQEQVTVKFRSEQVVVTTDAEGKILDNPARLSQAMADVWTFSRPVGSASPKWVLAATRVEEGQA